MKALQSLWQIFNTAWPAQLLLQALALA
jgi:hypothetical protein